MHFKGLLSGLRRGYYLVQVWRFLKMANSDQIIAPEMFVCNFCVEQKCAETPIL